jgi:hypothetical protein
VAAVGSIPVAWQYINEHITTTGDEGPKAQLLNAPSSPLRPRHNFCYMEGIATYGGDFSAKIGYNKSNLDEPYTEDVAKGTILFWNCLPLTQ